MRLVRFTDAEGRIGSGSEDPASGEVRYIDGDILGDYKVTNRVASVSKRLAPIGPSAILCIGLNYREHAAESGGEAPKFPVVFMKSPGTLQNPGDPVTLPRHLRSDKVDYEGELAVVIGKTCKNVSKDRALDYVLGYTCANDISARDWQREWGGGQYCRGKSFDTFAPLGPAIVTTDDVPDPQALTIKTRVNGELLQDGKTSDMIFSVATLIEFLSGSTTLYAGTVILTGTPQGVGMARKPPRFLNAGDVVTVEISGIGELTNPIAEERD